MLLLPEIKIKNTLLTRKYRICNFLTQLVASKN